MQEEIRGVVANLKEDAAREKGLLEDNAKRVKDLLDQALKDYGEIKETVGRAQERSEFLATNLITLTNKVENVQGFVDRIGNSDEIEKAEAFMDKLNKEADVKEYVLKIDIVEEKITNLEGRIDEEVGKVRDEAILKGTQFDLVLGSPESWGRGLHTAPSTGIVILTNRGSGYQRATGQVESVEPIDGNRAWYDNATNGADRGIAHVLFAGIGDQFEVRIGDNSNTVKVRFFPLEIKVR